MKKTARYVLLICSAMLNSFCYAQKTIVEWNFPNNPDDAIADIAIPINVGKTLYTVGGTSAVVYGVNTGNTTYCAWTDGWTSGANTKWWEVEFNTTGYLNLEVSSRQLSSATGPKNFALEYKIGAGGTWTAVPAAPAIVVSASWAGAVLSNISLPVACENQPSVYLRWIMTTNTPVSTGTLVAATGTSRIDDVSIRANDALNHYRSIATGNWTTLTTWEASPDLVTWAPADFVPNYYAKTITVRSPHTVSITSAIRIDETTINSGGTINYNSNVLTINNGAGVDLQVDGSFNDGSSTSAVWNAGATWALGANGTYTKTENTSTANWQSNYNGGISTVPATANWVLNKTPTSATTPSLVTIGAYYPNLTIMNSSGGMWTTTLASTFTGSSGFATVKGNLDIGGPLPSAFGTVDFLNDNTNATPIQVLGNMSIKSGSTLRNNGTGFEIYGNLIVNGSTSYSGSAARKFKFSGSNAQTISGSSSLVAFQVYQLEVSKAANLLTLNRAVKIDNNLNLLNGIVVTTGANLLTIDNGGTATNASNASFVRGPVSKIGPQAFTFPVGKNSSYRPIGMGAGGADQFTAEYYYSNPQIPYGSVRDPSLDHLSQCEFWILTQTSGSTARTVTLSWDATSCGVTDLNDLRIARWRSAGTIWNDMGNGGTTGGLAVGTITTAGTDNLYGPFTLSSITSQNPLPVELLTFTAHYNGKSVDLNWTTASEKNSDYFEVERAGLSGNFETILKTPAAGNSNTLKEYILTDKQPLPGTSFYRLRETDVDGTSFLSNTVTLRISKTQIAITNFSSNAGQQQLTFQLQNGAGKAFKAELLNILGEVILQKDFPENESTFNINCGTMRTGIYVLRLTANDFAETIKFIY